jgi:ABC-type uncharacterized transport system ATPase component
VGAEAKVSGSTEITLEDVVAAIKVLRKFIETQRQVQRMLAAVAPQSYSDPRYALLEKMLLAQQRGKTEEIEGALEEDLTPEERERLRRIASSLK